MKTMNYKVYADAGRGRSDFGWLDSRHSFSFGGFHDPERMGFGPLRVINDDRVAGGGGFPPHPHRDMEIISFVFEGALEHKDSMGNGDTIHAGDVQYMSAGAGVVHSEYNPSKSEATHFFQVWIQPDRGGYAPRYEKAEGVLKAPTQGWERVLKPDGKDGPGMGIRQDAEVFYAAVLAGQELPVHEKADRGLWLHVISGEAELDGEILREGDAMAIAGETGGLKLKARADARFFLFDVPLD